MKKYALLATLCFLVLCFSCGQPSPLYGTWSDNKGDEITMLSDFTYTAKLHDAVGEEFETAGSYNVLLNVITFTSKTGQTIVSEWDIRGNMLYLNWTPPVGGRPLQLTLYKTKN